MNFINDPYLGGIPREQCIDGPLLAHRKAR